MEEVMKNCDRFEGKIEAYLEERLSPEEISEFDRHIISCPSCLKKVVEQEPSKAFLLLREEKLKPTLLEGFAQEVLLNIEKESRQYIWSYLISKPAYALLVVALSIIGIFFAWLHISGGLKGGEPPFTRYTVDKVNPPIVQDVGEKGKRIYQFEIGEKTHLLMVVLPELEFLR
jgi:hypothetical protein